MRQLRSLVASSFRSRCHKWQLPTGIVIRAGRFSRAGRLPPALQGVTRKGPLAIAQSGHARVAP
jgi:hypothetical protein